MHSKVYGPNVVLGMQSEVYRPKAGTRPRVRLRVTRYLAAFGAIGHGTDMARARVTGLDIKSIWRAQHGEQIGELFMAVTIATLQRDEYRAKLAEIGIEPTLDSLFEVEVPDGA